MPPPPHTQETELGAAGSESRSPGPRGPPPFPSVPTAGQTGPHPVPCPRG